MADFSAQKSQTVAYDQYGRIASFGIPAGTYTGFTYDLEDQVASYQAFGGETLTNQYSVRGDQLGQSFSPNDPLSAGGNAFPSFAYSASQGVLVQSTAEEWDARSGAVIGFTNTGVSYGYDAASRLTSIAQGTNIRNLTYDAQNRQISGAVTSLTATSGSCTPGREASGTGPSSYNWGPDGQIESAQVSILDSVASETRHYVLGQLLYQGSHGPQYSAPEQRRALHLGSDATIGLVNSQGATLAQAQLGVNDIDFTGALTSAHNASGHDAWNVPNYYLQACSPQTAVPPASAGYAAVASDGMTEPAPGLLYDSANYIDSASARIISPVTLSDTTSLRGAFTSGVARRHAQDITAPCSPSTPSPCIIGFDPSNPPPVQLAPPTNDGNGFAGSALTGTPYQGGYGTGYTGCFNPLTCTVWKPHGGGSRTGGHAGGGPGTGANLGADWDPQSIAALRALGYTYNLGNAALQVGMVFLPAGDIAEALEAGEGAVSLYANTTGRSAQVFNITTDVTAGDAARTLESNGFTANAMRNGRVVNYTNSTGDNYALRPSNSAPGGIAADFTPAGFDGPTLKINFGP